MKARKILAVSLTAAMTLALAACGGSSSDKESSSKDSSDKVYKIGICQQLEHAALDEATKGFEEACEEKFGKDKVKFDLQNGQGEQANCATIVNNFVADNDDLILANATTALQCAAAATSTIPILGTSVTDYATALDISDWTGSTGMNISGTCDLAPIDEQEAMLKELLPDAKTVGILYCSAEPNSAYQAKKFEEALDKDGIKYKEYTAADSNEIQSVVTSAVDECDALYIPTDNTMASNTEIINNICLPAKVPVIAGEQGICEGCGIATLSISYYDLGYKTGEMAVSILQDGKDISKMPIEYAPKFTKELSNNIEMISDGKYKKANFNTDTGLTIEAENGEYIECNKLSIGTIDQLYLSLRLSATKEITKETIPIILDESFAYFDNQRLENVIKYLDSNYNNQIIIFTCTNREKEILDKLNIEYNLVNL